MKHPVELLALLALTMVESIIGEKWNSQELGTLATLAYVIGEENGLQSDAILYGLVKSLRDDVELRASFRKTANELADDDLLNSQMILACARTFGR